MYAAFWQVVVVTILDQIDRVENSVREEEDYVDDNNFLVCDDFLGLLAIESATEEQDRDDEDDGRQEFIRSVETVHSIESWTDFVVCIC